MNPGIYAMGRRVTRKKSDPKTKAQFAKAFGRQLYKALQERAIELRELGRKNLVDQSLASSIQNFWNDILEVYDKNARLDIHITTSLMTKVRRLKKILENFDTYIEQNFECTESEHLLLGMSLAELCEDVRHFTRQIEITHLVIAADESNKKLPYRPTDWEKKEIFIRVVDEYMAQHRGKFPPHNILAKRMALKGYVIPDRTYRDWKKQYRTGTVEHYVQDR